MSVRQVKKAFKWEIIWWPITVQILLALAFGGSIVAPGRDSTMESLIAVLGFICFLAIIAMVILIPTTYRIEHDEVAIYESGGKRQEDVLHPGLRFIKAINPRVFALPTRPESLNVEQDVTLPDGSVVKIEIFCAYAPDDSSADYLWNYYDNAHQLQELLTKRIKARLSFYSATTSDGGLQTWQAAMEAYEDIKLEVLRAIEPLKYGIKITELNVVSIRRITGIENVVPGVYKKPKRKDDVSSRRELKRLEAKMRAEGWSEPEIKRKIEKKRIELFDDE